MPPCFNFSPMHPVRCCNGWTVVETVRKNASLAPKPLASSPLLPSLPPLPLSPPFHRHLHPSPHILRAIYHSPPPSPVPPPLSSPSPAPSLVPHITHPRQAHGDSCVRGGAVTAGPPGWGCPNRWDRRWGGRSCWTGLGFPYYR